MNTNLYKLTDYFVNSLITKYERYGILGATKYLKLTEDGKYQVFPLGRLINVKIMKVANDDEYENLRKNLECHYKNILTVKKVYRCKAKTLIIDCRH